MKTAIVIGGGWAGLSAAVELAEKNVRVTLLEQSNRLGGRASSFLDDNFGGVIDNGQHLFMSCYHHTARFLGKIGSLEHVKFQRNLSIDFRDRQGRRDRLACPPLPSPFHLLGGLLRFHSLSLKEKWSFLKVARALREWRGSETDTLTAEKWLVRCGQSERCRRMFWDPVTLATLNERPDKAEASFLVKVLLEAFFKNAADSRLGIATVGLEELCGPPAEKYLSGRNGTIRRNSLASSIAIEDDTVKKVLLRDGKELQADLYISAVPYFILQKLLGEAVLHSDFFSPIQKLESSPILSIMLRFDRDWMREEMAGMLGTSVQWIFNVSRIKRSDPKGILSLVISGAHTEIHKSDEEILSLCLGEIRESFPESRPAKLISSRILRERNATCSPRIGFSKNRLPQKTPIKNLFLCGDWTETGLPATIESAVLSGVKAASLAERVIEL